MKTIKEWLKEGLSKEDYKKAKKYKDIDWYKNAKDFQIALGLAFVWGDTEEGFDYWEKIYDKIGIIKTDSIVEEVRNDLLNRSQTGIEKYGTTLDRTDVDLQGWLQHAYEETIDKALYLKRAIKELKNK